MSKDYEMITLVNYVKALNAQEKEQNQIITASVEEYLQKTAA